MIASIALALPVLFAQELAIGGGTQNMYSGRFGGLALALGRGGKGIEKPLTRALAWLAGQQDASGCWRDGEQSDTGATAFALAALLGSGEVHAYGAYRDELEAGVAWLIERQDAESGRLGPPGPTLVEHAVGTLVLCEAAHFTAQETYVAAAQRAVGHLLEAGGPTSFDAMTCGWSVLACRVAADAGLEVPAGLADEVLAHLDAMTDPSGHVIAPGDEAGEGMTAVALFARFLLHQRPDEQPVMTAHADDLMAHALDEGGRIEDDPVARHFGACGMFQMGGSRHWAAYNLALRPAVLAGQRAKGPYAGSWDPGRDGDRVSATALNVLNLEVYFRYGPLD